MTNPYRAMCAEILTLLDLYEEGNRVDWDAWRTSAHALLDEPVTEGPTERELSSLLYYQFTTSTGHGERTDPIGFARAVLARWGRQ